VRYAKPFFDLQFRFAETVAARSKRSLVDGLLDYTNFYVRFGLGRDFDPAHEVWQDYVRGVQTAEDGRDWTYLFYLTRPHDGGRPEVVATFGCFSYARVSGRLRLHFENVETDGRSPLAAERRRRRLDELRQLFAHVKRTEPRPLRFVGTSWLYNLDAYRRLFPDEYVASATLVRGRVRHMPLWGQFLQRDGTLREALVRQFLARLAVHASVDDVEDCFPLPVWGVHAPLETFYRFYGV
jgi:hypothetical protein